MVHLMSPAVAAVTAIDGKIADPRKFRKETVA
jgi:homoaconitase/3-isopropylmalate dehydratase large subunit